MKDKEFFIFIFIITLHDIFLPELLEAWSVCQLAGQKILKLSLLQARLALIELGRKSLVW